MNNNRALVPFLVGGVAAAVLLGMLGVAIAAWAAFDAHDDSPRNAAWWSPGMMGPQTMGPSSGYMGDQMRWMMGGFAAGSTTLTEGSSAQSISAKNFAFSPGNVRVPVGAKVTWKNEDDAPHIAIASDGSWSTPNLQKGQTASITFDKAGDYLYVCSYHPGMTGRLLVQ